MQVGSEIAQVGDVGSSGVQRDPVPALAAPALAPQPFGAAPAALALLGAAALGAAVWMSQGASSDSSLSALVPASSADLAADVVTPVDSHNAAALAAAVSALRLPDAQRGDIARAVAQGERRIGWIVLTDSIDPDGDTVSVEAAGIVQHVVLTRAWTPVAVPLGSGAIAITAVKDGGGGGITVGLASRAGALPLRAMLPGERIEVVP